MLTGPLYMLQIYDRVLASQSVPTLVSLTVLILVLYSTLGLIEWVRSNLFTAAASRFEKALSERTVGAVLAGRLKDVGRNSERPLRDLRTLRKFLASPTLSVVFDAPWCPLFFVVLFMLHPLFGLWAIFGAVTLVSIGLLNQRVSTKSAKEAENLERNAQLRAGEMARHAEALDAMGMRASVQKRWQTVFEKSDVALAKSNRLISGFTSGTKAFRLFLQSAILGLGAWLAIQGDASHGSMIAASILMGRAIAPIEQFVSQWRVFLSAKEAWGSLDTCLKDMPPPSETMALPSIKGILKIENLYAGPPGAKKPVLRNLNFSLEPGDVLGVLGPSAAGKSTLARILTGVWPILSGHVRIDGADLSQYNRSELGPQIGYLPQQSDLMAGTVRENISRFEGKAQSQDIIAAAQSAACHELILRLGNGYDTEVGAGGTYLSAGQRQRIGLARALYGNPNFVVLDEPNSNLDAEGDQALQQALKGVSARGATTIIVAHRPNAIIHCTKLLVLQDGEIRAFGPRDEILRKIGRQTGKVTPIRSGENHV
jgi:PrtD family type I secretion system ABC transporter